MKRLIASCGLTLVLSAGLLGSALPAAAQPGGACSLISDDSLSQVLGMPVHAIGMLSHAAVSADQDPVVADMCVGRLSGDNALIISHTVGIQTPGDVNSISTQGGGGPFGAVDPSVLTIAPVDGLGDAALMLIGNPTGQSYANLMVWRGSDAYSLVGTGLSDPQTSLTALAHTLLAGGQ